MGLILVACLFVLPNLLAAKLAKVWLQVPGLDKPVHFLAFIIVFLVAYWVLLRWPRPESERSKLRLAVGVALGISLADEVQQAVLGMGRTAEYGDLVADASGIFVGLTGVTAGQLGLKRAVSIIALLLMPVAVVTAKTYHDLKHYHRGMVYEREHDYQRARAEYQLALDSGFHSAALYNSIAWLDIEFLEADPVESEKYAAQALAMDPDNPDVLDAYGWVLVQAGRPLEGLLFLERAKALNPRIYCIDLHLGAAYGKLGEKDKAVQYLRAQIALSPADRFADSARRELRALGEAEK